MSIKFEVSMVIAASPDVIYNAWLDSASHTQMTGGEARVSDQVGEPFQAWDGYIEGRNLELVPGRRIVQSWRTSEFKEIEPDSQIEVRFEPVPEGTRVTILHTNLPPHGTQYEQGWMEAYFDPMRTYFEE
jgi:uncharacterized protein YndB with AHSA1/START domain